jgi:hypothetical protein
VGPKGEPLTDARFEATVTRVDNPAAIAQRVDLIQQGEDSRGSYYATQEVGEYRVTVSAQRNNEDLGSTSARFIVYQDDLELSNPAAEPGLLRQIAETTGGTFVPPEQLADHLQTIDTSIFTDYTTQIEYRLWDNWPYLLAFTGLLTIEWWLRKRHGWV